MVAEAVAAGKAFQGVHLVGGLTEYLRYEFGHWYAANVAAGDDVRIWPEPPGGGLRPAPVGLLAARLPRPVGHALRRDLPAPFVAEQVDDAAAKRAARLHAARRQLAAAA
jgi:hypothetical protein